MLSQLIRREMLLCHLQNELYRENCGVIRLFCHALLDLFVQ